MRVGLLSLLALGGCDGGPALELAFSDPVVEARARSALVQIVEGRGCEAVFDRPAAEVVALGPGIEQGTTDYPVRPEDVLPGALGSAGVVHVAARDDEGRVLARGCAPFEGGVSPGQVILRALPPCPDAPPALDLAVVYDASEAMLLADAVFGDVARVFTEGFVESADFPPGTRFSLYASGAEPARAAVRGAEMATALGETAESLADGYGGPPDLFAATALAAHELRDRASCARLPAVLVLFAGDTASGQSGAFPADAAFALFAAQGDRSDDIFAFGIGLTEEALADLATAIPEEVGRVRGARTERTLRAALTDASFQIRSRVNSP